LAILKMDSGIEGSVDADYVEAKIQERKQARADKDFARSDAIRDELAAEGIELIDTPEGTKWKLK